MTSQIHHLKGNKSLQSQNIQNLFEPWPTNDSCWLKQLPCRARWRLPTWPSCLLRRNQSVLMCYAASPQQRKESVLCRNAWILVIAAVHACRRHPNFATFGKMGTEFELLSVVAWSPKRLKLQHGFSATSKRRTGYLPDLSSKGLNMNSQQVRRWSNPLWVPAGQTVQRLLREPPSGCPAKGGRCCLTRPPAHMLEACPKPPRHSSEHFLLGSCIFGGQCSLAISPAHLLEASPKSAGLSSEHSSLYPSGGGQCGLSISPSSSAGSRPKVREAFLKRTS